MPSQPSFFFQQLARSARMGWKTLHGKLPRSTKGRIQLALLGALSVIILLLAVSAVLWKSKPAYWKQHERLLAADNATLQQLASQLEQRLLRDLSGSPEDTSSTRTIHLDFSEINAWLSIKLEDLLANRHLKMPAQVRHPMLAGRPGEADRPGTLIVAFEHDDGRLSQVVSVEIQPRFSDDGRQFQLKLMRARAGAFPLPLKALRDRLASSQGSSTQRLGQALATLDDRWLQSVQHHPGDARLNLRLTDVRITETGVDLTLKPEPRPPRPAASQDARR